MIEPIPPPSLIPRISSSNAAVSFASPPEKITIRLLAFLRHPTAAWVRPEHRRQAVRLRLGDQIAQVLVHLIALTRTGIDRVADCCAAQANSVLDGTRQRRARVADLRQRVRVVEL